jgi:hypothetical protein
MRNLTRSRAIVVVAVASLGTGVFFIQPVRAAIDAAMSCSLTTACLQWANSSSGNALRGTSDGGNAVDGRTKFKSGGKTVGKAGVLGEDLSTSGSLDTGVQGTSTNGTGVTGTSSALNGVAGYSAHASGVYGQATSASGFGVAGRNVSATHDNNGAGVLADGGTASDGLHAFAYGPNSNSIYAFSQSGSAIVANQGANNGAPELALKNTSANAGNPFIEADGPNNHIAFQVFDGYTYIGDTLEIQGNSVDPLVVHGISAGTGSAIIQVFDGNDNLAMDLSDKGDLFVSGHLYSSGNCSTGCVVGGKRVHALAEYAPRETVPTMEDLGEGQLTNGRAVVKLEPRFASAIDQHANYLVFLTPEGDCRGLYVAQKTGSAFTVQELQGGRSTLQFDYRIVAKPYGDDATRLPVTDVHPTLPRHRATSASTPTTPRQ